MACVVGEVEDVDLCEDAALTLLEVILVAIDAGFLPGSGGDLGDLGEIGGEAGSLRSDIVGN